MADVVPHSESNDRGGAPARVPSIDFENGVLVAEGDWVVIHAAALDRDLRKLTAELSGPVTFDLSGVGKFDTTGAWLVDRTRMELEAAGSAFAIQGGGEAQMSLFEAVRKAEPAREKPEGRDAGPLVSLLAHVGESVEDIWSGGREVMGFMGLVLLTFGRTIMQPARLRFTSLIHHMEQAGLNAIPIVMLMSFLVGSVLAYQGSEQLKLFGAAIFTVDLIGIAFLREIGILLTAIMVAGRSGSAFTAQIGSMKMREEIDAMRTLGLDPVEMLIVPRILALILTLPILAFLAGIAGLIGGGVVAVAALDISPLMYMERIQQVVEARHFWVGIVKAPFFAFLIGAIGCYEGLKVSGSAESVGRRTTQSVVEGIFVVIIADAFFSILFVNMGY